MAFRTVSFAHLARFNSAASSDFLDMYEQHVQDKLLAEAAEPSSKTFAPSSIRCDRISWFRLRGVDPDVPKTPDPVLNFTAEIGTACHEIMQRNLSEALGDNWIDVESYLKTYVPAWKYTVTKRGYETQVEILEPYPIRFACDGIIFWKGEYYLLEIKTAEFCSFDELTDPKSEHVNQIKTYLTLLGLSKALVVYQDRQYGNIKVYEMSITDADKSAILDNMENVLRMVDMNIAPDPLPKGDSWCTPSRCRYYKKCQAWGR